MNNPVEQNIVPRIGTQFFINTDDTIEDCRRHFALMHQNGIRLVRLFILWEHVEPRPEEWHFERYDEIYNLAATYQLKIVSTLTAEDPPHWFESKLYYHHYADLNRLDLKRAAAKYISHVVSRYHQHPAHYAWILMNEPELLINQNAETISLFQKWLFNKYKTIDHLNQKWFSKFSDFHNISIALPDTPEYWQCFSAFTDWHAFLKDNLVSQLCWIQNEIRKVDSVSPTHINPKGFYGNLSPVGQDYFKEGEVSDILGASIHPAWKFSWFSQEEYGLAFSFCVDLIRSAAKGKSFWVTELQSGPTVSTGIQPFTPSPEDITAWLWDAFGAGAKAVVYWMWHPRTTGQECGEWGMVSVNHKISKRLAASHKISCLLEKYSDLLSQAKPERPQVAIFYNQAVEVLSLIEGSPLYRRQESLIQSLCGIYHALSYAHIPVAFIDESGIRNGELNQYQVVYFPFSYAMDIDIQQHIRTYVENGGAVWVEAPFGWKNSEGALHRQLDLSYQIFGTEVVEFQGYNPQKADPNIPYYCSADLENVQAEIISNFFDGRPAVLHNQYGKGKTCFVNSVASLGFFQHHLPCFYEQIVHFAQEQVDSPFELHTSSQPVFHRLLQNQSSYILIFENWTQEEARCIFRLKREKISSVSLLTDGSSFLSQGTQITITMKSRQTAVLLIETTEN